MNRDATVGWSFVRRGLAVGEMDIISRGEGLDWRLMLGSDAAEMI